MVYNSPDINDTLNSCLLVIMLFMNLVFITKWSYLMILNLAEKYEFFKTLSIFIRKFILCKSVMVNHIMTQRFLSPKFLFLLKSIFL